LRDEFTEHGDIAALMALQGLDAAGIEASVIARLAAYLPERAGKVVLKSVA
jgi:1-deoxy-D-xylulose-5-phosphate synthase